MALREFHFGNMLRLLVAASVIFVHCGRGLHAQERRGPQWFLEWSSVEPRLEWLADDMTVMQQIPFDGTVTSFVTDDGVELIWNAWHGTRYSFDQFQRNRRSLEKLAQRPEGLILLARHNVATQPFDWRDELLWQTVLENAKVSARLSTLGRYQGILLDTEQYGSQLFRVPDELSDNADGNTLRALVRARGKQWITVIQSEMKDPVILLTFGFHAARANVGDGRPNIDYTMLADFLDGMLAAANANTQIIDGWEFAYGYQSAERFEQARQNFVLSQLPNEDRDRVRLGFGIWMDYARSGKVWNDLQLADNHFDPERLAASLKLAREHGDGIVWLYTDKPNWWTGRRLSAEYQQAVRTFYDDWKASRVQ